MGLNTTVRALLTGRSPGSSSVDAARIRNAKQVTPTDVANGVNSLQRQIDVTVTAASSTTVVEDPMTITDTVGSEIGWIGSRVVSSISYIGAWFKTFWLGGSGPSSAVISGNSSGAVIINGATFTLNTNGITTTITNATASPLGATSLKSLDNASSYWSGTTPTGYNLIDNLGNLLGYIRSDGGQGHISLGNVAGTNSIILTNGGGGSPKLQITSGAGTVIVSPGTPLSVFGNTVVDSSRVITGTDVVTPLLNGGTIPTTGPLAVNGSQQLVSATAGAGITLGATSITNSGVLSNVAGTGISVSGATGNVTITNAGVTSAVAGTGISVSGATGAVTVTNTAPFPAGGFTGSILLIGPTTNGSISVVDGIITAAVDPT